MSTDAATDREDDEAVAGEVRLRDLGTIYLKGVAMGAADTVPGVSGGTIALITGVYERMIGALTAFDPQVVRFIPRLHTAAGRSAFVDELRRMDVPFLVSLGLGAVTAVVVLSRVVHGALTSYPAETYAFFFGLIAASAVVLYGEVSVRTSGQATAAIVGFVVAFVLSGASSSGLVPSTLPAVFLTGTVTISAMILPGVSGAFILILLGQYEYLTGVLKRFVNQLLAVPSTGVRPSLVDGGVVVAVFAVGALIGLFSLAYGIRWALGRWRTATLTFLVSLMVGALRLPIDEVGEAIGAWTLPAAAGVGLAAAIGIGAVLALDRYTADLSFEGAD